MTIELAREEVHPVAWMYVNADGECEQIEYGEVLDDPSVTPLYTAPPQREWQGLTEDDWKEFMMDHLPSERYGHTRMRAVWEFSQSKLKEKNA
jgi:hypothetical protein